MNTIVIYGDAVQEARNRLRSAQLSTMFDILRVELFAEDDSESELDQFLQQAIDKLPESKKSKAEKKRKCAKTRIRQFVNGNAVRDLFAAGDALRCVGEYIEEGGGADSVQAFRQALRNKTAFDLANRARVQVANYELTEWPPLGIFKFRLLDRSVVKYMERFYGSYLGADISGTTTDSLAALAYLWWLARNKDDPSKENLRDGAERIISTGAALVPISSMVLQYHHTLLECGLALALVSEAMSPAPPDKAAMNAFKYYDFSTLAGTRASEQFATTLTAGNATLSNDLGGRGLVVVRDAIDINDNPYVDCEVGLLIDLKKETADNLFNVGTQYQTFYKARIGQSVISDIFYQKEDPSLVGAGISLEAELQLPDGLTLSQLIRNNSIQLARHHEANLENYFNDLDEAIEAAGKAVPPAIEAQHSVETTAVPLLNAPQPRGPLSNLDPDEVRKAIAIMDMLKG